MAVCKWCKHFGPDDYGFGYCLHPDIQEPKRLNPITGNWYYPSPSDCGDLNKNGNCKRYEKIGWIKSLLRCMY